MLSMESVRTCRTSFGVYQATKRSIPEECHLHTRRRDNLKSHVHSLISASCRTCTSLNSLPILIEMCQATTEGWTAEHYRSLFRTLENLPQAISINNYSTKQAVVVMAAAGFVHFFIVLRSPIHTAAGGVAASAFHHLHKHFLPQLSS